MPETPTARRARQRRKIEKFNQEIKPGQQCFWSEHGSTARGAERLVIVQAPARYKDGYGVVTVREKGDGSQAKRAKVQDCRPAPQEPKTPVLDAKRRIEPAIRAQRELLEFLRSKGYQVCEFTEWEDSRAEWHPLSTSLDEKLLLELHDIDGDAAEAERVAMLDYMRDINDPNWTHTTG